VFADTNSFYRAPRVLKICIQALANTATNSSSLNILMAACATQTTRTRNDSLIRKASRSQTFFETFFFSMLINTSRLLVWIGPLVVKELKRIVESGEITKWAVLPKFETQAGFQRRRFKLAEEKHLWETGTRDSCGKWPHLFWSSFLFKIYPFVALIFVKPADSINWFACWYSG